MIHELAAKWFPCSYASHRRDGGTCDAYQHNLGSASKPCINCRLRPAAIAMARELLGPLMGLKARLLLYHTSECCEKSERERDCSCEFTEREAALDALIEAAKEEGT